MTFQLLTLLLFLSVVCGYAKYARAQEKYCYFDDKEPYIQFATKSAYELVRAKKPVTPVPSCKPVMTWASIRHGTRYPSRKTIEEMKTLMEVKELIVRNHEEDKNGDLCEKDLQNLKNFTYRLSPAYEYKLSTQGKDDLRYLAKRVQAHFANVLNTPYLFDQFAFYHDGTERTIESTDAFFDGLFGPDISNPYKNSSLLKSADDCNAWVEKVQNNSNTYKEYEMFKESEIVHKMLAEVNFRLGFRNNMSLTFDVIQLMYDTCRYEKAWYIASRPAFCSVFSKEDLKVLEYMEDLKYYYEYSYGNDLNKKLACPLLADLLQRFSEVAESSTTNRTTTTRPKGIFYFSHTALHIPLITLLNMKKDSEPLHHNNYDTMSRREFMSSIIDPFSANLVAALYECKSGDPYRVIFYLNEDIVYYPGCESGMCSWKTLYETLKPIVDDSGCSFNFCNSATSIVAAAPILMNCLLALIYNW